MQVNKRDIADKIINDIGRQRSIERLRVINADCLQEFMEGSKSTYFMQMQATHSKFII